MIAVVARESQQSTRQPGAVRGDETQFSGILIGSEDPQRLVDYYTKLFGPPTSRDGGYTGWQLGSAW